MTWPQAFNGSDVSRSASAACWGPRLAASHYHGLALKQDGTVWAWGANFLGQLGDGTLTELRLAPAQVPGLTGVTAITALGSCTHALKQDGTVWAWGYNAHGELGDGTRTDRMTPVQVQDLTGVTAIAAGLTHTLFLKGDGSVWATGMNAENQLGDGTTTDRLSPVQVQGLNL